MLDGFGTLELLGLFMIAFGFMCLMADPILNLMIGR